MFFVLVVVNVVMVGVLAWEYMYVDAADVDWTIGAGYNKTADGASAATGQDLEQYNVGVTGEYDAFTFGAAYYNADGNSATAADHLKLSDVPVLSS